MDFDRLKSRLPRANQSFPFLRTHHKIYVDKTRFIRSLAMDNEPKFLSRPRRFGKSTLVSTLEELFMHGVAPQQGNPSCFKDLYIEKNWSDSATYPVIRLDFNKLNQRCTTVAEFEKNLIRALKLKAQAFTATLPENAATATGLLQAIADSAESYSLVLLIDEYDAPLTAYADKPSEYAAMLSLLQSLFEILKTDLDKFRCVFITGITRYKDAGLFTIGSNVQDISQDPYYGEICGYTHEEIRTCFKENLTYVACKRLGLNESEADDAARERVLEEMALWYDGYHFDRHCRTRVFSTWSVLCFFADSMCDFQCYWYEAGGLPALLRKSFIRRDLLQTLQNYEQNDFTALYDDFINPGSILIMDPMVLLFQTGYLTLKDPYISTGGVSGDIITLTCPNREIHRSLGALLRKSLFLEAADGETVFKLTRETFKEALALHSLEQLTDTLNQMLLSIDYEGAPPKEAILNVYVELYLSGLGYEPQSNRHELMGRPDLLFHADDTTVVFENKFMPLNERRAVATVLKEAVTQILSHRYGEGRDRRERLWRIALVYSEAQRRFVASEDADSHRQYLPCGAFGSSEAKT